MLKIVSVFVGLDTVRAILSFIALRSPSAVFTAATISLFAELIKFCVACSLFMLGLFLKRRKARYEPIPRDSDGEETDATELLSPTSTVFEGEEEKEEHASRSSENMSAEQNLGPSPLYTCALYAVPALLYLVNQLLFLLALKLTSPDLTQAGVMAKLPFTGVLHHFKIKRQRNPRVWVSLLFICVGLYVFSASSFAAHSSTKIEGGSSLAMLALGIGLVISFNSAIASIYSEILIKEETHFWVSQMYLYFWGTLFASLAIPVQSALDAKVSAWAATPKVSRLTRRTLSLTAWWASPSPSSTWYDFSFTTSPTTKRGNVTIGIAVIIVTALSGLAVAKILRVAGNLDKIVGTLLSLVTICVAQFMLFPELRESTLTAPKVIGCIMIIASTVSYNYYKR